MNPVILLLLCQCVEIFQAVQEKVGADLNLQILQLRLLQFQFFFISGDFQRFDFLHHPVEGIAHLLEFHYTVVGLHLCI